MACVICFNEICACKYCHVAVLAAANKLQTVFQGYIFRGSGTIVRRPKRKVRMGPGRGGILLKPLQGRLKPRRNNSGFDHCVKFKGKEMRVHRLMAAAFLEMPLKSKRHVNHIDKNPLNNRLSNLEVVTPKANMRHRSKR